MSHLAHITLTVHQSRRFIAKMLVKTAVMQRALNEGKVIVTNGITNAYLYEELTGEVIEPKTRYTAGYIHDGVLAISNAAERMKPLILDRGKRIDVNMVDIVNNFTDIDVLIKGANAFDMHGNAAILIGGATGGTIGTNYAKLMYKGSNLIILAGMEKFVPDLTGAAYWAGAEKLYHVDGVKCGLFIVPAASIFTEQAAFEYFNLESRVIASGGYDNSHGAITFALRGEKEDLEMALAVLQEVKSQEL